MRCPKCGYISFDHLTTCRNCSKDLTDHSPSAHGTTYQAAAPSFLKFSDQGTLRDDEEDIEMMPDELDEEFDVVDPDLDILIKDEDQEIEFNPQGAMADESSDDGFGITLDDDAEEESEDREIEIDLSQFEDASTEEADEADEAEKDRGDENFIMDLPDELADISDLSPPPVPEDTTPFDEEKENADEELSSDMLDIDLQLDDADTDFSLTSEEKEGETEDFGELSLDDIDLSEADETEKPATPAPGPTPTAKSDEMDMDADLNFDLDLGGLSLPTKK